MMDKYINQIFSSSSWSDVDVKEIPSWSCCGSEQSNKALLGSVVAVDEHEDTSSPTYLTNSYNSLESWVAQDVSSILQDFEPDAQDDGKNCEVQNMGMQYGVDGNMVRTSLPSIAPENVGCSSFEPPIFPGFNGDFETLSPNSQVWPLQSYEGVPSAIIPGNQMCNFGMNRDYGDNDIYSIASDHNNLAALVSTEKGMHDVRNYPLPSFSSAPRMPGLQTLPQNTTAPAGECARTGKPRMRARRGQATDPHSIAERLRREKIADRMKNLQELVPNSNKTDKASMLDEIIEYVRLLQLQVKELSMSKIGAAGAVVPLITDSKGCQTKVKNGLPQLPSIGQEADISFDETALEQVVRLMESDANKAMQHLKSKGFCLMPVALADAISTAKESSSSPSAPVSDDWQKKKTGFAGVAHNNSSSNSSCSPDQVQR